jgi:hypothetical protein
MEIQHANVSIIQADDPERVRALFDEAFERGTVLGYKAAIYTWAQNFYPEGVVGEQYIQDVGTKIVDAHTGEDGHITITNEEFLGKVYRAIVEKHGTPVLQPERHVEVNHELLGRTIISSVDEIEKEIKEEFKYYAENPIER